MSRMHNPPHPGEVLREWISPDVSVTQAAHALQINRVTLSNLLNGKAGITANIALRLSAWLGVQTQWDLWQARQQPRPRIRPLARQAA
ncbi:HigA family addiction module antitoxin [Paraburkholderia sacchari]|uniref:HigA family addiction module antitoxin n=1 Tax=Paraburkholderia sacchari TaxID=159450 RepID=UPI000542BD4F|nr:HigA family addiction module antitoxin [Paraburkholderia sacchari]NLP61500.1 HigA family addiction module antidote protein [Paraburkholderia sacchari]